MENALLSHIKYFLICCLIFCITGCTNHNSNSKNNFKLFSKASKYKVTLLLPLTGSTGSQGKMIRNGFFDAYNSLTNDEQQNITITVLDSATFQDPKLAYKAALKTSPNLIIGPFTQRAVDTDIQIPCEPITTLALNEPDNNLPTPANFYFFSLSPRIDARHLADYMATYRLQQAIIIAPNTDWGTSVLNSFVNQWKKNGKSIAGIIRYSHNTNFANAYQNLVVTSKASALQHAGVVVLSPGNDNTPIVQNILSQTSELPIFALPSIYPANMHLDGRKAISGSIFQSTPWLMYGDSISRQIFTRDYPDASNSDIRLYGFGRDTFKVSLYYLNHGSFHGLSEEGYMGYLEIGKQNNIERQMDWVKLLNGQFTTLDAIPSYKPSKDFLS